MSAANAIRTGFEQRIQNIDKMPWSKEVVIAYENFALDCRFEALQLANNNKFSEAFSLFSLLDSIWETPSLCSSFYVGIAKAILIQAQQSDALSAIRGNKLRIKSLQKISPYLLEKDASRLLGFLAKCRQPLHHKL